MPEINMFSLDGTEITLIITNPEARVRDAIAKYLSDYIANNPDRETELLLDARCRLLQGIKILPESTPLADLDPNEACSIIKVILTDDEKITARLEVLRDSLENTQRTAVAYVREMALMNDIIQAMNNIEEARVWELLKPSFVFLQEGGYLTYERFDDFTTKYHELERRFNARYRLREQARDIRDYGTAGAAAVGAGTVGCAAGAAMGTAMVFLPAAASGDPGFAACLLGLAAFSFGGIGGVMVGDNASSSCFAWMRQGERRRQRAYIEQQPQEEQVGHRPRNRM